jgi:hypothetical protein
MDLDQGSTLDRTEFLGGLHRMNITITPDEMNVLWPLFSLDAVANGTARYGLCSHSLDAAVLTQRQRLQFPSEKPAAQLSISFLAAGGRTTRQHGSPHSTASRLPFDL